MSIFVSSIRNYERLLKIRSHSMCYVNFGNGVRNRVRLRDYSDVSLMTHDGRFWISCQLTTDSKFSAIYHRVASMWHLNGAMLALISHPVLMPDSWDPWRGLNFAQPWKSNLELTLLKMARRFAFILLKITRDAIVLQFQGQNPGK